MCARERERERERERDFGQRWGSCFFVKLIFNIFEHNELCNIGQTHPRVSNEDQLIHTLPL